MPRETNAYDARISRGMAIGSIQGGLILTAIITFLMPGRYVWILPVVALIVAGVGLCLASQPSISWQLTWGATGVGGALVTSGFGLYIVLEGRRVICSYRALAPAQLGCTSEPLGAAGQSK